MTVITKPTMTAAVIPMPMTAGLGSPPSSEVLAPVGVARAMEVTVPELEVGTTGFVGRIDSLVDWIVTLVVGITAVVVVGTRVMGEVVGIEVVIDVVVVGRVVVGVVVVVVGIRMVVVVVVVGVVHVVVVELVVDDVVEDGWYGGSIMVVVVVVVVVGRVGRVVVG